MDSDDWYMVRVIAAIVAVCALLYWAGMSYTFTSTYTHREPGSCWTYVTENKGFEQTTTVTPCEWGS